MSSRRSWCAAAITGCIVNWESRVQRWPAQWCRWPCGWRSPRPRRARRKAQGVALPFEFSLYNGIDISVFAIAFGWAVYEAQRRIEWHRRLMFVALLNLFGPAFSRWMLKLPLPFPWLDMSPNLIADAALLALAWHDRQRLGRIHPVTLGAALILIPVHGIEPLIARSTAWNAIAPALLGFW